MLRKLVSVFTVVSVGFGCASDNGGSKTQSEDDARSVVSRKANVTTSREGDLLVERYDLDDSGDPDVIKYIESYQDPDNPDVTKRRMKRKEVDVNADGKMDIYRFYGDEGQLKRERVDVNLDGSFDSINHFDEGVLSRKQVLADDGETVVENRIYTEGNLKRVEKDSNQDGKVDHWEYYEDGVLQRIGRDVNGDEEIDKWVHRD